VKLLFLPSAGDDIVRQFEWYVAQGLPDVARRFRHSVQLSIESVLPRPQAGAPKHVRNPALVGLRTWPVKGFDQFHVYYLVREDVLLIVRVLHDKRDIGSILDKQSLDDPDID
jgi:toxin ParE1/3/4